MNKIKTCLVFLFTIALSAFVAACSSNNDEAVTPEIVIPENILTNGLNFSKAGGTNTLSIKANVSHGSSVVRLVYGDTGFFYFRHSI